MRIKIMPEMWSYATPTDADRPLAIAVERVVRPLPFSNARKARVRDDLFSHLKSIHEEESAKGGTSDEIIARSLARFGDPAEISTELRNGATWRQLLAARFVQAIDFRPTDSAEQFCFRFFTGVAAIMAVLSLVVWLVKWLSDDDDRILEVGSLAFAFGLVSLLVTAMLYFGLKFAETALSQRPRQVLLFFFMAAPVRMKIVIDSSPRVFKVVWLSLLLATYPTMYFVASYIYGDWHLLRRPDWMFLVPATIGSTLVGLTAGFGFMLERSYRLPWETLPIFPKESTS